jgi:sugar-specific transcriptional regulator TrmB
MEPKTQTHPEEAMQKLNTRFEHLKEKVEKAISDAGDSEPAVSLKKNLGEIGDKLKELANNTSDSAGAAMEDLRKRMDSLHSESQSVTKVEVTSTK